MTTSDAFDRFRTDKVILTKSNGDVYENIRASVQGDDINIGDTSLPIEEGDTLTRTLSNGISENYKVIETGYCAPFAGMRAHYEVKVEKQTSIKKQESNSIFLHASGQNSRINIGSTDHSTNVVAETITENNVFQKLRETIEQQVTSEDKNALLSSVDQLEQTKGSGKYNSAYKSFIQTAKDWTQILTPYIAILASYLQG